MPLLRRNLLDADQKLPLQYTTNLRTPCRRQPEIHTVQPEETILNCAKPGIILKKKAI